MLTGQNLMLHGLEGVSMTALLTCSEILGIEYIKQIIN
jgi:all-trans-retinol 13,14-reductase